jgi:toxin ParE1/3/4
MAEFRLSPAAERDLEEIWRYTRDEWGLEQAERYIDLLTTTFEVLAESPKSASACEHVRKGYRRRGVGRHIVNGSRRTS